MEITQFLLAVGLLAALFYKIWESRIREKSRRERVFSQKLEMVLQPRETVKVICPQKKGRVILTSKRVLFDTKDGFNAVNIKSIKKVQGTNEKGNRTTSIPKMVSLTLKAEQEYAVKNDCPEFEEFAKQLIKKTTRKKANRKAGGK